jgi:hypothetical protein
MKRIEPLFMPVITLFLFASVAYGQTSPQDSPHFKPEQIRPQQAPSFKPRQSEPQVAPRFKLSWGDAAYFGGAVADLAVSRQALDNNPNLREGNAFLQNDQGGLSLGKGIALKAAVWGFVKGGEAVFPEKRRWFQGILSGLGGAFVAIAWRNSRVR